MEQLSEEEEEEDLCEELSEEEASLSRLLLVLPSPALAARPASGPGALLGRLRGMAPALCALRGSGGRRRRWTRLRSGAGGVPPCEEGKGGRGGRSTNNNKCCQRHAHLANHACGVSVGIGEGQNIVDRVTNIQH